MPRPALPIAAGLLALALAGPAAEVTVVEVRVEGCRLVAPVRVQQIIGVRTGRSMSERDLPLAVADDVRSIARMGPFSDVTSELQRGDDPRRVSVVYRVRELPYVAEVAWEGLTYFQQQDAEKAVGTRKGAWCNDFILENDRRAVMRSFQDQGYRGCQVAIERVAVDAAAVRLLIRVRLGARVEVGRVDFLNLPEGARPRLFGGEVLLNRRGAPYHPEFNPLDEGSVVRSLQDQGWLDCRLRAVAREMFDLVRPTDPRRRNGPELVPDGEFNDRVAIAYDLDPGARYRLGSVSFVGNTVVAGEELRRAFALADGSWFKAKDVREATERSRRAISNLGYARCRVAPERRVDTEAHVVHLVLHVDEGRKYRIGRVDIKGNTVTRDSVVRRALSLHPGDWWNDDSADESESQLRRLGIFKDTPQQPLRVSPRFPDDRPGEADLEIDVAEDSTGSLNFQVGYSSAVGFFGQLGFRETNFDTAGALGLDALRGANHILEANASASQKRTSVSASWTDPHVADGPFSLTFTGARSDSTLRDWDERRIEGGATVGRNFLRNHLLLSLGYDYTDLKVKNVLDEAPNDASPGDYYLNSFTLSQRYDQLDNPRLPTKGWSAGASQALTGGIVDSSAQYWEWTMRGDGLLPLLEDEDGGVTFQRLSFRWRQARPLDADHPVPFYQRYLGGGPAPRFRGFGYNEQSPKRINQKGFLAREGGDSDVVITAELSIPLQGTNDGVRMVVFNDWGNVWAADEQIRLRDLRSAYGMGLRFPIQFPITLDFAWLLNPRGGEAESQVHFGVGQVRF